jgi:hypothetical protein
MQEISTGEASLAPAIKSISEIKEALRKLEGMSPNATCTILNDDKRNLLIVCGPVDPEADPDAIQDAADKILDAAGLNAVLRFFQDLRGAHLVIDAAYQDAFQE